MVALRVFLSHAHQDKPFADALVHALRGGGANVWYDEHNLGTGQLLDEITRELRGGAGVGARSDQRGASRPAPIQRIAVKRGRSAMWWSTGTASRSR